MSLINDAKHSLSKLSVFEKIIALNTVIFLLSILTKQFPIHSFFNWFELPTTFSNFIYKPWTILTYGFVHHGFLHVLLNMVLLYFIARLFINLVSIKTALNVYFLGIISGAVLFLLGYFLLPSFFKGTSSLVGASAGIRALLIFLCAYVPKNEVQLFTFKVKLWHIGVVILTIDILGLFGENSGGNLAHLGGVLLGYVYAKQLQKGQDIGKGFEKLADSVSGFFKPKSNLKTVHKSKTKVGGFSKGEFSEFNKQKRVDLILDKISKSGYESLSKEEKDFLFRAGK